MLGQPLEQAAVLVGVRRSKPALRGLRVAYAVLGAGLALSLLGCAGNKDETERRLRSLENRIIALQNETDQLREQLAQAQRNQESSVPVDRLVASEPVTLERPKLKVVRLEPRVAEGSSAVSVEATGNGDATEVRPSGSADGLASEPEVFGVEADTTSRPVIKVRGDEVLSR